MVVEGIVLIAVMFVKDSVVLCSKVKIRGRTLYVLMEGRDVCGGGMMMCRNKIHKISLYRCEKMGLTWEEPFLLSSNILCLCFHLTSLIASIQSIFLPLTFPSPFPHLSLWWPLLSITLLPPLLSLLAFLFPIAHSS